MEILASNIRLDTDGQMASFRRYLEMDGYVRFLLFKWEKETFLVLYLVELPNILECMGGRIVERDFLKVERDTMSNITRCYPSWKFVAGGTVTAHRIYYYSSACKTKYGFDRPDDEDEQRKLLEAVKDALKEKLGLQVYT